MRKEMKEKDIGEGKKENKRKQLLKKKIIRGIEKN